MITRLTDKTREPSPQDIAGLLGSVALLRLERLDDWLRRRYDLSRSLKFPFGPSYGWGYKYSHKQAHLCYAFFEAGAFTVTLQIGDPAFRFCKAGSALCSRARGSCGKTAIPAASRAAGCIFACKTT